MREILFRGKLAERFADVVKMRPDLTIKDNFIYGSLITCGDKCFICISAYASHKFCVNNSDATMFEVDPETVGQFTGLTDKNGVRIFEGDIVKIVDFQMGCVAYECGAFGIAVKPYIDWNYLDSEIAEITGCNNSPDFCLNDNLISLWELMWNYNQEENSCDVVQVIGNIHDSPELLEGDTE